jgi:hypothetical protein
MSKWSYVPNSQRSSADYQAAADSKSSFADRARRAGDEDLAQLFESEAADFGRYAATQRQRGK